MGALTLFCSYSTIPVLAGLLKSGAPFVTFGRRTALPTFIGRQLKLRLAARLRAA